MSAHSDRPTWTSDSLESEAVFDAITNYLQNASQTTSSSSSEDVTADTVLRLRKLFADATTDDPSHNNVSLELARFQSWRSILRYFFADLFHIITQNSPDSIVQSHLLTLVLAIRSCPNPVVSPPTDFHIRPGDSFWAELPTGRSVWADFERRAPLPQRPAPASIPFQTPPWPGQALTGIQWTSLNAFIAKLHVAAPELKFVDVRALFALIDALEDAHEPAVLDDLVPAASWWIIEAGDRLAEQALDGVHALDPGHSYEDGSRRLPSGHGDLWLGPPGLNAERWEFWRARFASIATSEHLATETRQLARSAANRMKEQQARSVI